MEGNPQLIGWKNRNYILFSSKAFRSLWPDLPMGPTWSTLWWWDFSNWKEDSCAYLLVQIPFDSGLIWSTKLRPQVDYTCSPFWLHNFSENFNSSPCFLLFSNRVPEIVVTWGLRTIWAPILHHLIMELLWPSCDAQFDQCRLWQSRSWLKTPFCINVVVDC